MLSARVRLKQMMGRAERLVERYAEPLAALWYSGEAQRFLDLAWRRLIEASCHDSVTGCGSDETAEQVAAHMAEAEQLGRAVCDLVTAERAAAVPLGSHLVFNPTPAARTGLVVLDVPCDGEPGLVTGDGRPVPVQTLDVAPTVLDDAVHPASALPILLERVYGRVLFGQEIRDWSVSREDRTLTFHVTARAGGPFDIGDVREALRGADGEWRVRILADPRRTVAALVDVPALGLTTVRPVPGGARGRAGAGRGERPRQRPSARRSARRRQPRAAHTVRPRRRGRRADRGRRRPRRLLQPRSARRRHDHRRPGNRGRPPGLRGTARRRARHRPDVPLARLRRRAGRRPLRGHGGRHRHHPGRAARGRAVPAAPRHVRQPLRRPSRPVAPAPAAPGGHVLRRRAVRDHRAGADGRGRVRGAARADVPRVRVRRRGRPRRPAGARHRVRGHRRRARDGPHPAALHRLPVPGPQRLPRPARPGRSSRPPGRSAGASGRSAWRSCPTPANGPAPMCSGRPRPTATTCSPPPATATPPRPPRPPGKGSRSRATVSS
ncbi:hypothetical protein [Actinomadura madurae]|uniref:hypothetical protein n=1 Tax=Actinomadura madurae TaxID=1993 RepID=UPI0027E33734|nr:hypothetical protein [Actinomadura madurae]